MYRVTKRDGALVDFNLTKISDAMKKAFDACKRQYNDDVIDFLALKVTADFEPKIKDGQAMPTFTSVQVPSDDYSMAFSATLPLGWHHSNPNGMLPVTVMFCDFASAGGDWCRGNTYRTWFPLELHPPH